MPARIPTRKPRNVASRKENRRRYDRVRAREQDWRKWYQLPEWKALRAATLEKDPFCVRCLLRGIATPSTVANHIRKHNGEWSLFADPDNLEGVCKPCHDSEIQAEERKAAKSGHIDKR